MATKTTAAKAPKAPAPQKRDRANRYSGYDDAQVSTALDHVRELLAKPEVKPGHHDRRGLFATDVPKIGFRQRRGQGGI